jgi:hypothetical protein
MRGCERLWVRRQPWKAAAKERMGGVDDLNVSQGVLCQRTWVVERGMNMCARSIRWTTSSCCDS